MDCLELPRLSGLISSLTEEPSCVLIQRRIQSLCQDFAKPATSSQISDSNPNKSMSFCVEAWAGDLIGAAPPARRFPDSNSTKSPNTILIESTSYINKEALLYL